MRSYLRNFRALFSNRALVVISISSAFRSMTQSALLTFLPVYLANQMGYSPFVVGACLFALQAAGFAAAPIAGHLSDRMGRRSIVMSSMATTAVVLVAMALSGVGALFLRPFSSARFFLTVARSSGLASRGDAAERALRHDSLARRRRGGGAVERSRRSGGGRPARAARDVLFPCGDHRGRQPFRGLYAQGRGRSLGPTPPDDPRGVARDDGARRHLEVDHGARADDGSRADPGSLEQRCARADPDIVAEDHGGLDPLGRANRIGAVAPRDRREMVGDDDFVGEERVASDPDRAIARDDDADERA